MHGTQRQHFYTAFKVLLLEVPPANFVINLFFSSLYKFGVLRCYGRVS